MFLFYGPVGSYLCVRVCVSAMGGWGAGNGEGGAAGGGGGGDVAEVEVGGGGKGSSMCEDCVSKFPLFYPSH